MNQDGARPDSAQAKRECKRMHDEHVKKIQQEKRPIFVIHNHDNEEDKHLKESTSTTIESILEPAKTFRIRPRQQIGAVTVGRREIGTLGVLRGLTIRECFSEFRTSFGCWWTNFPITDGECEQNTHSYRIYRCAQCVST